MNLIAEAIKKGLISFDEEQKFITYIHQNKKRNYTNPEEQIQAEIYLKLILTYGYSPNRILQFVPVKMGSTTKEADIIVYNDDDKKSPHIVVECKKQDISELEFKQAIEQGFSYAVAEGAKYVWVTSGIKNDYYLVPTEKPKARQSISDIPQFGVTKLAKFKYAKNGGKVDGQKLFELEIVSEDDLTRRFKQAHNALWGGGELNPSTAFDELDKLIFCKIWDEKKPRKKGEAYDFQIFSEDNDEKTNLELINRIKSLYDEGRKKDPEVFKDDIRLTAEKLRTVVGYLEGINLGDTDLDSKGRAFETFMGSFFRGDFGQYFTPRNIVKFIVDVLPITNDSLVLDTSCGSGGFLLHVLDKIRCQADEYYDQKSVEHYKYWHDFAEKNLFGIEINEQIARTAKMNMIIHDDGHTNVISADGLLSDEEIINKTNNQGFTYNKFDFIITNPPFGSTVKLTEQAYMKNYYFAKKEVDWLNPNTRESERDNQNTEILFIEQCYNFLAENGYLAIVIPDGILTNSSLQYVRDGIEEKFRIVAVISLPQTAFTATGAGVKSSILFLKKYPLSITEKIQQDKLSLQESIKVKHNFDKLLAKLDKEKKDKIKKLIGFDNVDNLEGKALQNSEAFKEWKKEVNNEYKEKIDEIKQSLLDEYVTVKASLITDYNIFMAIAEDIGYDATGKATNNNELDIIAVELTRFIDNIKRGEDSFFLAENVDKNKLFLVKLSDLHSRFDPVFNLAIITNQINSCFPFAKLNTICKSIITGGTPSKAVDKYWLGDIPWLSAKDFKDFYLFDSEDHITQEAVINSSTNIAKKNSLLIVFRSSILIHSIPVAIAKKDMAINQDIKSIIFNSDIIPTYIGYFINVFQHKILPLITKHSTTVHSINSEQFLSLNIPIPPIEIQEEIVEIMDNAYKAKKEKEKEAEKLLNSIDEYLLKELGIQLPKQEENTVKSRMFCRKLSDISGNRFDPFYYQKYYIDTLDKIKNEDNLIVLKNILSFLESGSRPKGGVANIDYGILSFGGEHINNQCEIGVKNPKYVSEEYHNLHKLTETKINDLLLVKDGATTGKIGIIDKQEYSGQNINEHLFLIRCNNLVNPIYLLNFLNSKIGNLQLKREITGATVTGITKEVVKNLKIILPPLEKQEEIAENISKIREKAKQLKEEAKRGLEEAKIEVERMILG